MPEIREVTDDGEVKFEKGDRVVLRGLTTAPELNGRHGVVAAVGLRCAVHLDILKTFLLPPANLEREADAIISKRADVYDGALYDATHHSNPMEEAAHLIRLFHLTKWMSCTHQLKAKGQTTEVTLAQVIAGVPTEICHGLHAYAIQNWQGAAGVYQQLKDYSEQEPISQVATLLQSALADRRAMKSWHCGIQNIFWFVGRDSSGTFVVPDLNQDVVYKIVGIVNKPNIPKHSKPPPKDNSKSVVSIIKVPMRLRVTIFPWYGRLLYDTTVPPPDPASVVYAITATTAAAAVTETVSSGTTPEPERLPLASHLHSVVMQSIQSGRVLEHLVELDTPLESAMKKD